MNGSILNEGHLGGSKVVVEYRQSFAECTLEKIKGLNQSICSGRRGIPHSMQVRTTY